MLSAIRAILVYSRSRAPEEFGPVTAASDARSSRVSGIPAGSAAAASSLRRETHRPLSAGRYNAVEA